MLKNSNFKISKAVQKELDKKIGKVMSVISDVPYIITYMVGKNGNLNLVNYAQAPKEDIFCDDRFFKLLSHFKISDYKVLETEKEYNCKTNREDAVVVLKDFMYYCKLKNIPCFICVAFSNSTMTFSYEDNGKDKQESVLSTDYYFDMVSPMFFKYYHPPKFFFGGWDDTITDAIRYTCYGTAYPKPENIECSVGIEIYDMEIGVMRP